MHMDALASKSCSADRLWLWTRAAVLGSGVCGKCASTTCAKLVLCMVEPALRQQQAPHCDWRACSEDYLCP